MGFPGVELAADSKAHLRPLVGLQVWLHGRDRASEWVQVMAARVIEVNPEGLYIHWAGLKHSENGQILVQNLHTAMLPDGLDLYDLLRIDGPVLSEEAAEAAGTQLERTIKTLLAGAPKPAPPPAAEKPWWDD